MSRSFHVTERQRKRDRILDRDAHGRTEPGLSKLDELSLKKVAAKGNEHWRRAAAKVGALRYRKFAFKEGDWKIFTQKLRGRIPDVPGEVVVLKKKDA